MNSLSELNNYSASTEIEYTDNRTAAVIFDRETADNQAVSAEAGQDYQMPVGIEILDIINYSAVSIYITIDATGPVTVTLTWDDLPETVSLDDTVPNVYNLSNIKSINDWNRIKSPTVTMASGFQGYYTYSVTINYIQDGNQSKSYVVASYIGSVSELSTPLDFYFTADTTEIITNNPIIVDTTNPATFTVTVTPSDITRIINMSSAGSGGTSSFNGTSKVLTITGTNTQVNSHLNSISMTTANQDDDFILTYFCSNNFNAQTDSKEQNIRSISVQFLDNTTTDYYNEDTAMTLEGGALITDTNFADSVGYTLTITPSTISAVTTLSSTGSGGSSSFNNTTKILTLTGTRAQINSHVANITFTPGADYDQDFYFTYSVTTPRSDAASKIQNLLIAAVDTEITNLNLNRSYFANRSNLIFSSNTPQIEDVTPGATYTVFLNCGFGKFMIGTDDLPINNYSISGTRTEVNSLIASIRFYPNSTISSNGLMTWSQYKNGSLQLSQNVNLIGTYAPYQNDRDVTFNNSGTWTPTVEDVVYARVRYLLVAGGGGGGGQGGGAGGQVKKLDNVPLSLTNYNIVIGGGGLASTNWGWDYTNILGQKSYFGVPGGNGSSSSAFGYTATGGEGGKVIVAVADPSGSGFQSYVRASGGSNADYDGGVGGAYSPSAGVTEDLSGGGAGASEDGGDADTTDPIRKHSGDGGDGTTHPYFTGRYGPGGGGGGVKNTINNGGQGGEDNGPIVTTYTQTYGQGATRTNSADVISTGYPANTGGGGGGGIVEEYIAGLQDPIPASLFPSGGGPSDGASGVVKFRILGY